MHAEIEYTPTPGGSNNISVTPSHPASVGAPHTILLNGITAENIDDMITDLRAVVRDHIQPSQAPVTL